MGVTKYRSVEQMPGPPERRPLDPQNLRLAVGLMNLADRLRPVRRVGGVRRYASYDEMIREREQAGSFLSPSLLRVLQRRSWPVRRDRHGRAGVPRVGWTAPRSSPGNRNGSAPAWGARNLGQERVFMEEMGPTSGIRQSVNHRPRALLGAHSPARARVRVTLPCKCLGRWSACRRASSTRWILFPLVVIKNEGTRPQRERAAADLSELARDEESLMAEVAEWLERQPYDRALYAAMQQ